MAPKINLKERIFNSTITEDEKWVWYNFLHVVPETDLLPIVDALDEDPSLIGEMTKNLFLALASSSRDSGRKDA